MWMKLNFSRHPPVYIVTQTTASLRHWLLRRRFASGGTIASVCPPPRRQIHQVGLPRRLSQSALRVRLDVHKPQSRPPSPAAAAAQLRGGSYAYPRRIVTADP
ncbi:hypothetical protein AVEN_98730-1 [Araneus ventricosus]|uniref:Uncharacterized protein n=1 Tax=Araneus ventricosus TaxID=182803 RepID=A0A4Y2TLA5_ARAVE|nr:hypothetical protein AVEN_98730-1 [Araneus ventricosus]